jgi:multicomponent K+:H+ antiporter subunit D
VGGTPIGGWTWTYAALVIFSGFAVLVAMLRSGIRTFWAPLEVIVPRVLVVEAAPVALLIALCLAMTVQAGELLRYTDDAARALHAPSGYIARVLPSSDPGPEETKK